MTLQTGFIPTIIYEIVGIESTVLGVNPTRGRGFKARRPDKKQMIQSLAALEPFLFP